MTSISNGIVGYTIQNNDKTNELWEIHINRLVGYTIQNNDKTNMHRFIKPYFFVGYTIQNNDKTNFKCRNSYSYWLDIPFKTMIKPT